MQAVILAGGKGTRLRQVTGDLPKPLVDIAGRPLLVHQLELARAQGVGDILILTGYRSAAIEDHVGDGSRYGVNVTYRDEGESEPLGAAGALLSAFDLLEDRFFVFYGDCFMKVDLGRMLHRHKDRHAEAVLFVHPNDHPYDSDLVEADEAGWIEAFHTHPHPEGVWLPNRVNAALHTFDKAALKPYRDRWSKGRIARKLDIGKHLLPMMLSDGCRLLAYNCGEYVKDAGTPDRLERVIADLRSGRVDLDSLVNPQPAIFLDRDGTLNVEVERVRTPGDLELIGGAAEAVRMINRSGLRAILVTNQAVLARGDCDEPGLRRIHAKLETLLGREGAWLDAIYYCPHHPHRGYPGEVAELKIDCDCRKPKPGMVLHAKKDFNLDLRNSWMIGDSALDARTARATGMRAVLVRTGKAGADLSPADLPDFTFDSLLDAIVFITGNPLSSCEMKLRSSSVTDHQRRSTTGCQ
jgi:D,D-heptose 1,7-bisphosphate phosphatase